MSRSLFQLLFILSCLAPVFLQAQTPVNPFKLGNFDHQGRHFVGIVLNDGRVIDFATANLAVSAAAAITAPADMKDLINRYDTGIRRRIIELVNAATTLPQTERPAWLHDLAQLKILPPVMPSTMMNTALNYTEHALEMKDVRDDGMDSNNEPGIAAKGSTRPAGIWEPAASDRRWNPYMFLKSPSAIIAHNETIHLPAKREQIDWECELGIVVGRTAKFIPPAQAADYIFGYTLQMDVSDREDRGDTRYGSDWLMGKSYDTFAPLGPFITPREFIANPKDLDIRFVLNGNMMQESNTRLMIHNVFELLVYASNILTLKPGDVVATGTPSGVGSARKPPIFLQDGDRTSCTYEGVGTLDNSVVRDK